ncbi:MAG TPA: sorbosone dehydrogenase family protein, partial [Sphingomonas sp.]|nr:sorbosone dehydrogenase family protein [Sphingomonas sp.]
MRNKILIALGMLAVILAGFWFWLSRPDEAKLSVEAVMGKRPKITEPRDQTFPTVQIADAVGWAAGAAPTPAAGLAVQAFARNLDHPRWLYRLPNGDVPVAEANSPKREGGGLAGAVMNRIMNKAGAGVPSANRITLL